MPAVIAPQHDNGIALQTKRTESIQQLSDLCVRIGDTGSVVFSHIRGELGIRIRIASPLIVLHVLARPVPRGLACGFFRMWNGREMRVAIGFEVFRRCTKWEVRPNDAHSQKERAVTRFGPQLIELAQGFFCDETVRIDRIGPLHTLKHVHVLGVASNLSVGQAMHGTARVLPGPGRQQVPVPGQGHLQLVWIIPVFAAAPTRMVRHLAH